MLVQKFINTKVHWGSKAKWYLGIWQLKELKDPMSRADAPGSNVPVLNLVLADEAEASESMASLGPLEKTAM